MLPAFTKNASENGNNTFCRAKMKIMVYVSVTLYIPGRFSFKCFEFNLDTISNNQKITKIVPICENTPRHHLRKKYYVTDILFKGVIPCVCLLYTNVFDISSDWSAAAFNV